MISLRTESGIMLAGLILLSCIYGCSAWSPGNPSTPEESKEADLTPRPAGTDSKGGLIFQKQADQHDRAAEQK
jgi:hypothetical protein